LFGIKLLDFFNCLKYLKNIFCKILALIFLLKKLISFRNILNEFFKKNSIQFFKTIGEIEARREEGRK